MTSFTAFALNVCNKKKISLWLEDMKVPYVACFHHSNVKSISLCHREISYIYYHTHQFVGLSYYVIIYTVLYIYKYIYIYIYYIYTAYSGIAV